MDVFCLLYTFNDDIFTINKNLSKNEYNLKEIECILIKYLNDKEINKLSLKKKLHMILDVESTNDIIDILFGKENSINFITLNRNIDNLLIK